MPERKGFFANLMAGDPLTLWLTAFVVVGVTVGVISGFFKARKIQPRGFKLKTLRNEILVAVIGIPISGLLLGWLSWILNHYELIQWNAAPAAWWQVALEYALYFFLFDTWFYWLHRWMHKEPMYKLIHKVHHWSTSPNLMTTTSVNPLESLVNGGFVPLFTALFTVHQETLALILPTNIVMGYYVHSGYEFFPKWWNKSWLSKWFITATFHDQHHRYFTVNYGGYTTIWDRICGTMRPKYEAEFEAVKDVAARHAAKKAAEREAGLAGPEVA